MDLNATLFWEPMMQHSDFKLTDDELKRINEIIQKQIVPGEQNDGVVVQFMYWVTGRMIQVSHSGAEFEDVDAYEFEIATESLPSLIQGIRGLVRRRYTRRLEAHPKLKQVPFYTSTLLDRLSVIYKEFFEEFISTKSAENHTEDNFVDFLVTQKQLTRPNAKEMLRSAIKNSALFGSKLANYVAVASKDSSYPVTIDLLNKTVFPSTLYLEPSSAKFTSEQDHRNAEAQNFADVTALLVHEACLDNWVQNVKGKTLTNEQLKARRIWHKGSVLTWSPYLKGILSFALHAMTNEEREKVLYRSPISSHQQEIVSTCLRRLFSHPMWDEPVGEIDSLLVSARKQDDLFAKKGLTKKYVIYGQQ